MIVLHGLTLALIGVSLGTAASAMLTHLRFGNAV
jgi:hypothetical protein